LSRTRSTTSFHALLQRRNAFSSAPASKRKKNVRKLREGKVPRSEYPIDWRSKAHLTSAPRDTKLLSFSNEDGGEEEEEPTSFKKKPLVRPDCKFEATGFVDCSILNSI
jgi:hypothetical protein